jgi:hypothetical protein
LILAYLSGVPLPFGRKAAFVPVFKEGGSVSATNYKPISTLNTLSKIFKFVICGRV